MTLSNKRHSTLSLYMKASVCFTLINLVTACSHNTALTKIDKHTFLDTELSFDDRVEHLVNQLTTEEKISQMVNDSPAIERLGIPAYNWWSEGLHGVARAGLATVFPQAIGLAATWDEAQMFEVANAISDEARAKHHAFTAKNKRFIYQGLSLWSPNINIFKDPRWGRGQETYGEDPWLTGRLAVQFIKGLQGDNPKYLKTIATVKHFAVHNGPEPERHEFEATTNAKDLWETYLPQFEMGIKEAGAHSVMCAYNRYNGEAACGSDYLLKSILREQWDFDGFVVSDCGAIADFHTHHKVASNIQESAALGVRSGTDLNCGKVYSSLGKALEEGLLSEAQIDTSVKRLFKARMKLGMFDSPNDVAYSQIPYSIVDSPKHQDIAIKTAEKSIVLLKNEQHTLPLQKTIQNIAVIGPNADQWLMLLGNYNGVPSNPITPLQGIKNIVSPKTVVTYAQGTELAPGIPMLYPVPSGVLRTKDNKEGLTADFYDNSQLSGDILFSELHPNIDVNWNDRAPRADMDDDNFGVRWSGLLTPTVDGLYQIGVISTCNTKVWLNNKLIASTPYAFRDEYGDPRTKKSDWIKLKAGQKYEIRVTAGETYADAQVQLVWAEPKSQLKAEALNLVEDADVVVMVMGLTARMEGEEMEIKTDGFRGGDRTKLTLPENQVELIKEVHATGKPIVLVLLNGGALALNWEHANIPAIIEAWYPGQAAGTALANVLFGDYNPAGRLPVTFYKSVDDLPAFDDYNITTQTYRYFKGVPLYPFGYGLSYSQYTYSKISVPKTQKIGSKVSVSVQLQNTGKYSGDEVAQLYITQLGDHSGPIHALKAFKRVHLAAGEQRQITFDLDANAFASISNTGSKLFSPNQYEVSIGGGQPNTGMKTTSNVVSARITFTE